MTALDHHALPGEAELLKSDRLKTKWAREALLPPVNDGHAVQRAKNAVLELDHTPESQHPSLVRRALEALDVAAANHTAAWRGASWWLACLVVQAPEASRTFQRCWSGCLASESYHRDGVVDAIGVLSGLLRIAGGTEAVALVATEVMECHGWSGPG